MAPFLEQANRVLLPVAVGTIILGATSTDSGVSFAHAGRRLQVAAALDQLGFFVIFTAMISMRFL